MRENRRFQDKWADKRGTRAGGYRRRERTQLPRRDTMRVETRAEPRPAKDGKCSPLCPLFWCGRRAYRIRIDRNSGRKYVFCEWIGDECIGASCQYASCKGNYLLPDGSCGWFKQRERKEKEDMFKEIERDMIDEKARNFLAKRVGKEELEDYYL